VCTYMLPPIHAACFRRESVTTCSS
jgi:hypothetical protein